MRWVTKLKERYFAFVDRVDARIDKPAKERGTFTSGSEQMIDDELGGESGRAAANRRSGYGRGI